MPLHTRIVELSIKYLEEDISPEETEELEQEINRSAESRKQFMELTNTDDLSAILREIEAVDADHYWNKIQGRIVSNQLKEQQTKTAMIRRYLSAAAILLLAAISIGLWLTWRRPADLTIATNHRKWNVPANYEGSYLLEADAYKLPLDSLPNGTISLPGINLTKVDSTITFSTTNSSHGTSRYIRLYISQRKYTMVLPDTSHVIMNQATAIRFPAVFDKEARVVAISGEAYFEVNDQASSSFKAVMEEDAMASHPSPLGEAIATGTRFNVRAYKGEDEQTITLTEGKLAVVRGVDSVPIKAGQQAIIPKTGKPYKQPVEQVATVTGWKDGLFVFHNADIKTIMQELEKQYGVHVTLPKALPAKKVSFTCLRTRPLKDILDILREHQYSFTQTGNKIIVYNQ